MSKTLYRTYRPQDFSDVLGQDHIVNTLTNAITTNRIGHAYLFTGPRGTGKTTVARILATAVNTEERGNFNPVSEDTAARLRGGTSMDLIEIDAASNTGVDDIRALKETVGVSPTEAIYKVYIIDEVHMLSPNAFNALLKTLEEPPEHVIFILATTEIHKVPDTIISRCQRFDFSRFTVDDIVKKLSKIAKSEKIQIEETALEMIAIAADGGMRDAESILAQVFTLGNKNITEEDVSQILGTTASKDVIAMLDALSKSDTELALTTVSTVVNSGYNTETFVRSLIEKLRILLFLSIDNNNNTVKNLISVSKSELKQLTEISNIVSTENLIFMIEEFTTALQKIKNSTIPQLPIEIAAINICNKLPNNSSDDAPEKTKSSPSTKSKPQPNPEDKVIQSVNEETPPAKESTSTISETPTLDKADIDMWEKGLAEIEKENKSVASLLSQCDLTEINNKSVILVTTFSFYAEKIKESTHKVMIDSKLTESFNCPMIIEIVVQEKKEKENSSELLDYATQLMGSAVTE